MQCNGKNNWPCLDDVLLNDVLLAHEPDDAGEGLPCTSQIESF